MKVYLLEKCFFRGYKIMFIECYDSVMISGYCVNKIATKGNKNTWLFLLLCLRVDFIIGGLFGKPSVGAVRMPAYFRVAVRAVHLRSTHFRFRHPHHLTTSLSARAGHRVAANQAAVLLSLISPMK